jgi:hypothetical protein
VESVAGVFAAASSAGLELPIRTVPLAEVEQAWSAQDDGRTVFII